MATATANVGPHGNSRRALYPLDQPPPVVVVALAAVHHTSRLPWAPVGLPRRTWAPRRNLRAPHSNALKDPCRSVWERTRSARSAPTMNCSPSRSRVLECATRRRAASSGSTYCHTIRETNRLPNRESLKAHAYNHISLVFNFRSFFLLVKNSFFFGGCCWCHFFFSLPFPVILCFRLDCLQTEISSSLLLLPPHPQYCTPPPPA
jgi:hypothetical protein